MGKEKATSQVAQSIPNNSTQEYESEAHEAMPICPLVEKTPGKASPGQDASVLSAVAASMAIQELDRLHALECLPTPELLMGRLLSRSGEFNLVCGVALAYLKAQEVSR